MAIGLEDAVIFTGIKQSRFGWSFFLVIVTCHWKNNKSFWPKCFSAESKSPEPIPHDKAAPVKTVDHREPPSKTSLTTAQGSKNTDAENLIAAEENINNSTVNRVDSLKDNPTQDQSSVIKMDSKSPDKSEDNVTTDQDAQQIQPSFYLYKILRAHILPLTNCAFNGDGSRYSVFYLYSLYHI